MPLKRIPPPPRLLTHRINEVGEWYSWSSQFHSTLVKLASAIPSLPRPRIRESHLGNRYNRTFTLEQPGACASMLDDLRESADFLSQTAVDKEVLLFSGLIDDDVPGEAIHYLFSFYQAFLSSVENSVSPAMYTPLGAVSQRGFRFPLHPDLYLQKQLFLVFDNVSADDSGHTLLLPTDRFFEILSSLNSMPTKVKAELTALLTGEIQQDSFDEFVGLLYQRGSVWLEELYLAYESAQIRLKFLSGEGVLLHDRRWLHGRTSPTDGVPQNRIHRFAYNPC